MTQKKGVTSSNLSAQKTENLSTHSILTNTPSKSSAKKKNLEPNVPGSEPGLLRSLPPEPGGQGEEHVHLHRLHPDGHEDDPGLLRGAGRLGGHGAGHQPGGQQEERSGG